MFLDYMKQPSYNAQPKKTRTHGHSASEVTTLCRYTNMLIIIFYTLGINVPEGGLKKLVKMKRLGMSKIPCGHKRAYCHVEEQC